MLAHRVVIVGLCVIGLCAGLRAAASERAVRARGADVSPLAANARFARRLTVRVSGMPLDELLPALGREMGVMLRPADEAVGALRVSVFAAELPARRILAALAAMLNMTPDGGFAWRWMRAGARPASELREDLAARQRSLAHVRAEAETLLREFPVRVRALRDDPELRKQ